MHAVLMWSATLLNAPWVQTAAAMQATQTALAADLLHCDVVGAFTAGALHAANLQTGSVTGCFSRCSCANCVVIVSHSRNAERRRW